MRFRAPARLAACSALALLAGCGGGGTSGDAGSFRTGGTAR